jgi:hypothetical protein
VFRNVRIESYKGIRRCELVELGRLNILCGRNSSGKSSVMEAIATPKSSQKGKEESYWAVGGLLRQETVGEMFESMAVKIGKQNWSTIQQLLGETIDAQELWTVNEGEGLAEEFILRLKNAQVSVASRTLEDIRRGILQVYKTKMPKPPSYANIVLIPPKRILQLDVRVESDTTARPNGVGVIQHIFIAQNRNSSHKDHAIFKKVNGAFQEITKGHRFHISMQPDASLKLEFASKDGQWIDAKSCGLGFQDLLIVLYFAADPSSSVVLVEEPENHLHPDMQRRLLSFLKEETDKQFFLSTHSNVFLDNVYVDRVFFCKFEGEVQVDDATSRAFILDDLGYDVTDNLVSDLIILTEGPTDIPVIEEFLQKMGLMSQYSIKLWPLGGDIMAQVDLSVFAETHRILAVIDNDPGSRSVRKQFMDKCRENGIQVHRLSRYSIENYFSLRALREVFGAQVPETLSAIQDDKKLEDQLGLSVKKKGRALARSMSLQEIEGTDLHQFLLEVDRILGAGREAPPAS